MPRELPRLELPDTAAWSEWLAREGATSQGVMLIAAKKAGEPTTTSITYESALDEALCHGWIDSGGNRIDDVTRIIRFTPRKAKGLWSKRNVGFVERLEREGRIQPAGRAAIDAAKADGRWDSAYSASGSDNMPPDFVAALEEVPAAKAMWEELNKGNRWKIYFTLLNLKTQAGREKRINAYVDMLAKGETPVPQKTTPKRTQRQTQKQTQEKTRKQKSSSRKTVKGTSVAEPTRRSSRLRLQ